MGKVGLAFRVFWRTLRDRDVADRVERLLQNEPQPIAIETKPAAPTEVKQPVKKAKTRSEALTLLAAMQREGRFVDFIREPIAAYSDAQIGAAVRDVHRGCSAVLERMFDLRPLRSEAEGAMIEVPVGYDAARFHLTGNVSGQPPHRGQLAHHGWEAGKCELPAWTGSEAAAMVVSPAEVELK